MFLNIGVKWPLQSHESSCQSEGECGLCSGLKKHWAVLTVQKDRNQNDFTKYRLPKLLMKKKMHQKKTGLFAKLRY